MKKGMEEKVAATARSGWEMSWAEANLPDNGVALRNFYRGLAIALWAFLALPFVIVWLLVWLTDLSQEDRRDVAKAIDVMWAAALAGSGAAMIAGKIAYFMLLLATAFVLYTLATYFRKL